MKYTVYPYTEEMEYLPRLLSDGKDTAADVAAPRAWRRRPDFPKDIKDFEEALEGSDVLLLADTPSTDLLYQDLKSRALQALSRGIAVRSAVYFKGKDLEELQAAAAETGSADQYSIYSPIEIINSMNDMIASMSAMLLCVAAISLLVGGIGIMNIMYVNVLERTREIGVRTAIGASPAVIMAQFITEAVILSLMGGITGVFIGTAATFLASEFIEIPLILSARALLLALGVSVSIGILFGIMPARKAAVLDPVMALGAE